MAVAYNAETDCLGLQPNPADGQGITTGRKTMSVNRWLRADFGFELLKRETYRIEANEDGAEPPYIIRLNGRRKPAQ
ncbi:MAG: hypothetical protein R3C10_11875 [Pirellulales bacterium]